ncbi:ATP-dependent nuclease [Melittangium boletus]|uniref:ATP-dependent nuclease n=1 Tax=Melittangium boletus TaxID=83453 RepID=UPI003DA530FB
MSQVLAMLYVLVTADVPRVLIIDEPNSFLHPGAVRALIEILREHPQHQYIISTHSPDLISACNPSTTHILRKKEGATVIESVDARETKHLRSLLMEVGARLSDVFGSDSVLWVEGKTEEICFPLIVQKMLKRPLSGVSIVGVLHTGDFDSADARSAFRIYEKLTGGQALLPPAIAFIFDRELRPEKDRQDLIRQSQGKVSFLQRRTYENYLLHAEALASVLKAQPGFESKQVTSEQVQAWIDKNSTEAEYYPKGKTRNFMEDVDAPRLLGDLFAAFSDNTLEYNKVQHSLALTEWLLEHAPAQFQEIADLLASKLPAPANASRA